MCATWYSSSRATGSSFPTCILFTRTSSRTDSRYSVMKALSPSQTYDDHYIYWLIIRKTLIEIMSSGLWPGSSSWLPQVNFRQLLCVCGGGFCLCLQRKWFLKIYIPGCSSLDQITQQLDVGKTLLSPFFPQPNLFIKDRATWCLKLHWSTLLHLQMSNKAVAHTHETTGFTWLHSDPTTKTYSTMLC